MLNLNNKNNILNTINFLNTYNPQSLKIAMLVECYFLLESSNVWMTDGLWVI
jgi:hypothetical protein